MTPAEEVEVRSLRLALATQREMSPVQLPVSDDDLLALIRAFMGKDADPKAAREKAEMVILDGDVPVIPIDRLEGFITAVSAARGLRDTPVLLDTSRDDLTPYLLSTREDLSELVKDLGKNVVVSPSGYELEHQLIQTATTKAQEKRHRKASRPSWRR